MAVTKTSSVQHVVLLNDGFPFMVKVIKTETVVAKGQRRWGEKGPTVLGN